MEGDISPPKKLKQDAGTSSEEEKDDVAGCSDDKKPVKEEGIPFPCIVGFTGGKLTYWKSADELRSEPTVIIDKLPIEENQTFTAVAVNRKISILTWEMECFAIDLDKSPRQWNEFKSMAHLHGPFPPATALEGIIYACGGGWDWEDTYRKKNLPMLRATKSCEKYVDGEWSDIPDMNEERGRNCAVALEGHVYSIGGSNKNGEALNTVERYNPSSNEWKNIEPLKEARYDAAAVAHDGKLYVTGGLYSEDGKSHSKRHSIECYDPGTDTWTFLTLACHISTFSFGGKVITVPCEDRLKADRRLPCDDEGVQIELFKSFTQRPDAILAIE